MSCRAMYEPCDCTSCMDAQYAYDYAAQQQQQYPDPCQVCSEIVGGMTECRDECAGVTDEASFWEACRVYAETHRGGA